MLPKCLRLPASSRSFIVWIAVAGFATLGVARIADAAQTAAPLIARIAIPGHPRFVAIAREVLLIALGCAMYRKG